jgi:hypothetical protein
LVVVVMILTRDLALPFLRATNQVAGLVDFIDATVFLGRQVAVVVIVFVVVIHFIKVCVRVVVSGL